MIIDLNEERERRLKKELEKRLDKEIREYHREIRSRRIIILILSGSVLITIGAVAMMYISG